MSRFYITTTLPYVNAKPHIGFGLEILEADAIARFHRSLGDEVVFNTGVDEHGTKIYEKALELGKTPQEYCDEMVEHFMEPWKQLNISYTHFIRTTDTHHESAAQEFWKRCEANGDIYKKQYSVRYCVGCELEKTDSDLVDGKCPIHPNTELQIIEEENYFFHFSKYQETLLKLYKERPDFVVPKKRMNEIVAFVERGLSDFSISRLKAKMPWGVPVPGDDEHVMYVWFDALVNYISTLGWSEDTENFEAFWPGVQICGKDNLRQQSAMWQAMLFSAGLSPSKQILINGFINVGGQKMSKSLGNVIAPEELVEKFGIDGTRYLLLSGAPIGDDTDVTWERLTEKYNADLANGLGNLVSRVLKLAEKTLNSQQLTTSKDLPEEFVKLLEKYKLSEGLEYIWAIVRNANKFIEENKPWELAKTDTEKFEAVMKKLLEDLALIAQLLPPFMPTTVEKMQAMLTNRKGEILFGRLP
ncbi:MAG: methionine--tRNA ligase [Candidatus Moranbacteria bacterium]|nr:methionine--tRNA ligase [Candidatus Moranbacteria bacterium]